MDWSATPRASAPGFTASRAAWITSTEVGLLDQVVPARVRGELEADPLLQQARLVGFHDIQARIS
jgi:hypothetical protein